jgi:drug/metabolite transporter (DMT)-like permease
VTGRGTVASRLAGLSTARRAALIFVVAGLVFSLTDAITKSLVSNLPVVDVVFGRHVTYLVAVIVLAGRTRPLSLFATARLRTQVLRGLAMFVSTATFFLALSLLPLAEVSTLASTTPLIIVALAGPLLGERVTRSAVLGALVGFGGVVALIGVDLGALDPAMFVPLATAASFAIFSMLTRVLRAERPEVTLFYSGLVGMIAAAVLFVVIHTPTTPRPLEWAAIGVIGLTALTGHRLLVEAYRIGRASDLAPLGYLGLVWAFLNGAIIFGEPVELRAIIGAALIAIGGVLALRSSSGDGDLSQTSVDYGDPVDLPAEKPGASVGTPD